MSRAAWVANAWIVLFSILALPTPCAAADQEETVETKAWDEHLTNPKCVVADWRFTHGGADSSGNGNTLVLHGGAQTQGGKLILDGNPDSFAQMKKDSPQFDFGDSDFTVLARVSFDTLHHEQVVIEKWDGKGGWSLSKFGDGSDGGGKCASEDCLVLSVVDGGISTQASGMSAKDYHTIVVCGREMNKQPQLDVWLDGVRKAVEKTKRPMTAANVPILVGRRHASDPRKFPYRGKIDRLAVLRRALSESEIRALGK